MKYDPWKIIEASFRKHMLQPEEVQKKYEEEKKKGHPYFHYSSAEEYYDEHMHHNFEYFKWYEEGNSGKVIFDDNHNPYNPLGLFYGQDAAVPRIRADLCKYVENSYEYLISCIAEAILKLQGQKLEVEMMYIPKHWNRLLSNYYCGMSVETGKHARVISSTKYGRFVEIGGLE